jgi:hypothetical protein
VATHEAGTPAYQASSITRLSGNHRNVARTLEVLGELGMLVDDRQDRSQEWLRRRVADLPDSIRSDVLAWAGVLRDGDRRNQPKTEYTWKNYLQHTLPVLREWSSQHTSPRDHPRPRHHRPAGTRPQRRRRPQPSHGTAVAVQIPQGQQKDLQQPGQPTAPHRNKQIPPGDPDPAARHRPRQARRHRAQPRSLADHRARRPPRAGRRPHPGAHAGDVDVADGRLRVGSHTRPLDKLTAQAIQRYLAYRNQRWPYTSNPHLLITQQSAHTDRPVSRAWIGNAVRGQATNLDALRQDRILDEATAIGVRDPLHLAAMFALHPDTAQRYVEAIHGRRDDPQPPQRRT